MTLPLLGDSVATNGARPKLTVVLMNPEPGAEWDWIRHLLTRFDVTYITAPDGSVALPGALYIYYKLQQMDLPSEFLERVAAMKGCGLMHIGDEYLCGDYRTYASFDYVLRNFSSDPFEGPGLLRLPLGMSNNLPEKPFIQASQRKYVWSFCGGRRPSRLDMATAFADVKPNFLDLPDLDRGQKPVARGEYLDAIAQSAFIPCVEGNVQLETIRPYEALQYGAIPILPKRRFRDSYQFVLGEHPLTTFASWPEAAQFAKRLSADPAALDRLQAKVIAWWKHEMQAWPNRVADLITVGTTGAYGPELRARFRDWGGLKWTRERMFEFALQQGAGQVRQRLMSVPKRLSGKSVKGVWTFEAQDAKRAETGAADTNPKT